MTQIKLLTTQNGELDQASVNDDITFNSITLNTLILNGESYTGISGGGETGIQGVTGLSGENGIQGVTGLMGEEWPAGLQSIALGASGVTIDFASLPDTDYAYSANWVNQIDSYPQFQPIVATEKTASSFTLEWNSPTDSENYSIEWMIRGY